MSALSGSLSYQRFFVERTLARDFVAKSHAKIVGQAMRPLSPNEPEAERSGWCVMGDPLDVELDRSRVLLAIFTASEAPMRGYPSSNSGGARGVDRRDDHARPTHQGAQGDRPNRAFRRRLRDRRGATARGRAWRAPRPSALA